MCVSQEILNLRGLKRVFVEDLGSSPIISLNGRACHHLGMVLKARPGEEVLLMDRRGRRARALVEEIKKGFVCLKIQEKVSLPIRSEVELVVLQALLKNPSNDYLIQRLSELGVTCIAFFEAKRGICKWNSEKLSERLSHWDGVAVRAYLQCDRYAPISIKGPFLDAEEAAKYYRDSEGLKLVFHERASTGVKEILRPKEAREAKRAILAVGPEGGFTQEEIELFMDLGFVPTCIGPRILKAESVAMVAASIMQYEMGDLNGLDR